MATFFYQAQYSAAAFKGMVTAPADRQAAANALLEAVGMKMISFYYVPATAGIVGIIEGSLAQGAAAEIAICASGGFSSFSATEVLSSAQMHSAMKAAAEVVGQFKAPNGA